MKAYNHTFIAADGTEQNISIADFEDGRYHMFWGGRRWAGTNYSARLWVAQRDQSNGPKSAREPDYGSFEYRRRRRYGVRLKPADLLDYVKDFINKRVTGRGYTDEFADELMQLDNRY